MALQSKESTTHHQCDLFQSCRFYEGQNVLSLHRALFFVLYSWFFYIFQHTHVTSFCGKHIKLLSYTCNLFSLSFKLFFLPFKHLFHSFKVDLDIIFVFRKISRKRYLCLCNHLDGVAFVWKKRETWMSAMNKWKGQYTML